MKTPSITIPKTVKRIWYEIDAAKAPFGRVATEIANLLRGKLKRDFTPHMDMGDFVVVKNADHLKFSGRKIDQKKYFRHSGYLGGIKSETLKNVYQKNPEEVLKRAVFSMLDDVHFRKTMMSRMKFAKEGAHTYKIDKVL